MEKTFLNNCWFQVLLVLISTLLLSVGVGCEKDGGGGKNQKTNDAEVGASVDTTLSNEVDTTLSNEVSASVVLLTAEEKDAVKMRDLLDEGQTLAAIRLARNLMDSGNKSIRSQVLETLQWVGPRALPEITEMVNDSDSDISAEALSAWEQVFSEISGEHRQASVIAETLPKLNTPDPVNAILQHATELDERIALPMLAQVIAANTNFIGECARDMYSHITGGEIYESVDATRRYLEESRKVETIQPKSTEQKENP